LRKIVIIAVALTTLVFAGEKWIEYGNPNRAVSLPDATPMVGVLPPTTGQDFPNVDSIKYDDNTSANGWEWMVGGNGWGVKFVRPASSVTLAGALFHQRGSAGRKFLARVFDSDGPNGAPGTALWNSDTLTATLNAWTYVPIGTPVIDRDFYVFWIQADTYPTSPFISVDAFRNTPVGSQWALQGGSFSPSDKAGDWMIRAVIDWTPQTNNLGAMIFSNIPLETIPAINLTLKATFKNFGTQNQTSGVHAKCVITGPLGYYKEYLNDTTAVAMPYRGSATVTFRPNWRIPDTAGLYTIKTWIDLPADEYRANDTMVKEMSIARWISYSDWNLQQFYVVWGGPERAQQWDPADFSMNYPVQITRIKHWFYEHPQYPWDDTMCVLKIYGDDGSTLLWESDTTKATPNASIAITLDPPLLINSGTFWTSVYPRGAEGHPSSVCDTIPQYHSYTGDPGGGWNQWTYGEFEFALAAATYTSGVAENTTKVTRPVISVQAAPNPARHSVINWQAPRTSPVRVTLYDAAGKAVSTLVDLPSGHTPQGTINLDSRDFARGVYLLKLEAGDYRTGTKLVLR